MPPVDPDSVYESVAVCVCVDMLVYVQNVRSYLQAPSFECYQVTFPNCLRDVKIVLRLDR